MCQGEVAFPHGFPAQFQPVSVVDDAVHPRTRKQLVMFGLWGKIVKNKNVVLLEPLGYHEMLRVTMGARLMMTDSGGLQEECCVLGIPCLTMRWNTERPITLMEHGGASISGWK